MIAFLHIVAIAILLVSFASMASIAGYLVKADLENESKQRELERRERNGGLS